MKILFGHGYMLTDTGSNIYTRFLAGSLAAQGAEVFLFSQELHPKKYVDQSDDRIFHFFRPDIGSLLPVFVKDRYAGFTVKTMLELSEEEIENYIALNAEAMEKTVKEHSIDFVHVNHAILLPQAALRVKKNTGVPFSIAIHGSDLEYAVSKNSRLNTLAEKALLNSSAIFVPSRYIKNRLKTLFQKFNQFSYKINVIPLGVDLDLLRPRPKASAWRSFLNSVNHSGGWASHQSDLLAEALKIESSEVLSQAFKNISASYNQPSNDAHLKEKLRSIDPEKQFLLFCPAKLIPGKGVHLLFSALCRLLPDNPDMRLLIAGFGPLREPLEMLIKSDPDKIPVLADFLQSFDDPGLRAFAQDLQKYDYRLLEDKVVFLGQLAYSQIAALFPATDLPVIPSLIPEAFGLIVVESLASGKVPLVADQGGLSEIIQWLEKEENIEPGLFRFPVAEDPVGHLVKSIKKIVSFDAEERSEYDIKARQQAELCFNWQNVADSVLNVMSKNMGLTKS